MNLPDNFDEPPHLHQTPPRGNWRLGKLCLIAIIVLVPSFIWLGPLTSGGLFLTERPPNPSVIHGLPADFEPLHKGHVDYATGLYVREDEDLVLAGDLPFVFRRTYLSGYHASRQFGVGATHSAEWFVIGDLSDLHWADLILESGARIHFSRVSWGSSYLNAMFEHRSSATEFYGSRMGWTGSNWVMRRPDGTRATFQPCGGGGPDVCSLTLLQDGDDHTVRFERDRDGTLRAIRSEYEWIDLTYDDEGRIAMARDDIDHRVSYTYDSAGRLARAEDSEGNVHSYEYGRDDEMLTARDPGRLVQNTFDADGRVVRQVTTFFHEQGGRQQARTLVMEFAYHGPTHAITQTDVTDVDRSHAIYRFDAEHRLLSEVVDAASANPIDITYASDPAEHLTKSVTVSCLVGVHRVNRTATVDATGLRGTRNRLLEQACHSTQAF